MKAIEEQIKQIFIQHPDSKELYRDSNGVVWTGKTTASLQSKGGKVEVLKRSEYIINKQK